MILIYSEEINPRIEYITRLIFNDILKTEIEFTLNSVEFIKSESPKLNYSFEKFGDEIYIKPHRLLYSKALIQPDIQPVWFENEKYFFESSKDSVLPFDPFAASFYLVTRYEEYLETEHGKYKRYPAGKSILSKYGLLKKPVVNIWANLLAEKIHEKYPKLVFPERKFQFFSTIDIDNAWAFRHKGFLRSWGALLKAALKGDLHEIRKSMNVFLGNENDPYDTYAFLDSVFKGNEKQVIFFFLLADYGRYDKNVPHKNRHLKQLIKQTAEKYEVGIHPSYFSSRKRGKRKLLPEIKRLEKITDKKPAKSRQHFLRLRFPRTYRRLIKAGIESDFTMGYASKTGFRAGICTPYYFYDLKKETATNLRIWPFQVMDVTLHDYLALNPEEAIKETELLMDEVKKVGGTFVSIWHNETVNDLGHWDGYRRVFETINRKGFEYHNE